MSYVQSVLQPGEEVKHVASIHWFIYWPGTVLLVLALIVLIYGSLGRHATGFWIFLAVGLALAAFFLLFREWFKWWTTEIAVTNRRIIYKQGFIGRNTVEMHMDKVESVDVEQSIMGRLLDYGNVTVKGVGTGFEPLLQIAQPLELRNQITGV